MKNQRLLLIVPIFKPLHEQIVVALEHLGYNVTLIPDFAQKFTPYAIGVPFKKIKKVIYKLKNFNIEYHKKYEAIYQQKWDILLCINGWSIESEIIETLKSRNPNIKTVLYLWDSTSFYEFQRNFYLFDLIYTFDPKDAKNFGIHYLPLFWVPIQNKPYKIEYDISFVGKYYGDRYLFLKMIESICRNNKYRYSINLILTRNFSLRDKLYRILRISNGDLIKEDDPIVSTKYLSANQVSEITSKSRCIVDTEIQNQYGLTNRMIISLAQKKKVITTNSHILEDPIFYDNPNIKVTDRSFPCIDKDFVYSDYISEKKFERVFEELRIDNWLNLILNGKTILI